MSDTPNRGPELGEVAKRLLEEAMKQPGVKDALEVNQSYQDLLHRANLDEPQIGFLQVTSVTRSA